MTKKLGQLAIHVSAETERQIKALAQLEGVSSSSFLCDIVESFLSDQKNVCDRLSGVFYPDDQRSNRSMRSDSTE